MRELLKLRLTLILRSKKPNHLHLNFLSVPFPSSLPSFPPSSKSAGRQEEANRKKEEKENKSPIILPPDLNPNTNHNNVLNSKIPPPPLPHLLSASPLALLHHPAPQSAPRCRT